MGNRVLLVLTFAALVSDFVGDQAMNDGDVNTAKPGKDKWTVRVAAAGGGVTIIGFLCAPLGVSPFTAMSALGLGSLLLIAGGIMGAIGIARGGAARATTGTLIAVVLGLAALVNFGSRLGGGGAPIHDISTDTDNPPEFIAVAGLRAENENPVTYGGAEVAAIQAEAYPDIETIVLLDPPSFIFQTALEVAADMGWEIVASDADSRRIEATATTPFVGFKDDVVVRITTDGAETRVDVRSKSRIGGGDMGVNAERIRTFRENLVRAASP
jgi:hypothetical protein